jgi:CHAD domain-containing protein
MAGAVAADARLRTMRRDLKRLLGECSALRDVQVQLLLVQELLPRHPQLELIRTMLLVKERRLVERLRREIARGKTAEHAVAVQNLRESVERVFCDSSRARLRRAAVVATATAAYATAVQRRAMIDRRRPATIHALRVAFKKFRYKAEMLQPLLPWLVKERLRAMNGYQTRMGEIQDVEVFLGVVREQARRARLRRGPAFRPVILELLARRRELLRSFFAASSELYDFWTIPANAPEAAFAQRRGSAAKRAHHD